MPPKSPTNSRSRSPRPSPPAPAGLPAAIAAADAKRSSDSKSPAPAKPKRKAAVRPLTEMTPPHFLSEEELKIAEAAAAAEAARRPATNAGQNEQAAAAAVLESLTDEQLLQHYYYQQREVERVQTMEKENGTLKRIVDELRRRLDNHIAGEREHSRHLKGVALRRKKEKHELKLEKDKEIDKLKAQIKQLQDAGESKEKEWTTRYQLLLTERERLQKENDDNAQFKRQKESMTAQLTDLEQKLASEHQSHSEQMEKAQQRGLIEKNRLKNEMLRKIRETKLSLLAMTEDQLHTTTKRTIMENEQMTTELQYQSKETERVLKANTKLTNENRALRRQLQLHEEARDLMATRTQGFQKLIAKLQARLRGYEQHEAAMAAAGSSLGMHDSGLITGGAEGRLKWMKELRATGSGPFTPSATTASFGSAAGAAGVPQSPLSQRSSHPPLSSSGRKGRPHHRQQSSQGGGGGSDEKGGDSSDEGSSEGGHTSAAASSARRSSNPHRTNAMATAAARLSTSLGSVSSNNAAIPADATALILSTAEAVRRELRGSNGTSATTTTANSLQDLTPDERAIVMQRLLERIVPVPTVSSSSAPSPATTSLPTVPSSSSGASSGSSHNPSTGTTGTSVPSSSQDRLPPLVDRTSSNTMAAPSTPSSSSTAAPAASTSSATNDNSTSTTLPELPRARTPSSARDRHSTTTTAA